MANHESTQNQEPRPPSFKRKALRLWDEKFVQPAKQLDNHEVAYAVGIGFWNGLLPLPGLTVPSQLAVLMVFKLFNKRLGMSPVQFTLSFAMHLVTGISTMEILMMVPYFNVGNNLSEYLLSERTSCSVTQMMDLWSTRGLLYTLKHLPVCILLALGAWFLSGLVIVPVLYSITRLGLAWRHGEVLQQEDDDETTGENNDSICMPLIEGKKNFPTHDVLDDLPFR